jgi:hypothetical protein
LTDVPKVLSGIFFNHQRFSASMDTIRLPEMRAIFYAAGPDFKRRTLKEVDNIDLAPTLPTSWVSVRRSQAQERQIHSRDYDKP